MPAAPIETRSKPHVVYRAYDRDDTLLYIGMTSNWIERLRMHNYATRWWRSNVVRTRLTLWPNREAAMAAERKAIIEEQPPMNTQGYGVVARRKLRRAT